MTKTVKVTLAGREYLISEKRLGPANQWRERFNASQTMRIFQSLDGVMAQLVSAINNLMPDDGGKRNFGDINVIDVVKTVELLPILVNGLSHSIDEITEMLFDYSPELAADREWIEENSFTSEAVEAFIEVLKLCFPFLALLALIRGQKGQSTSTNSPTLNGASGRKALERRTKA